MANFESTQQLIFLENEYDILEKQLMSAETAYDIYKNLSDFLSQKFFCSSVSFCSNLDADFPNMLYQTNESIDLNYEFSDRKKTLSEIPALKIHLTGSFSAPFKDSSGKTCFVFVGSRKDGLMYPMAQLRDMVPVVRTLNKSLVFLEATKNRLEKDRLRYAFSKYLSPDIVNNIITSKQAVQLGGEKANLSVVFTDLQNFTDLSDGMAPEKLVRVLNEYLNEMSQVIISLGGTIDKFEGDAIMAFFGAPKKLPDHPLRCCLSALRMKRMENFLNEKLIASGLIDRPLVTRIGINTGDVIVGNVGSMQRLDYTIIGANVNIASRLEAVNKRYGTHVLVSENTYKLVKDFFDIRFVDEAELKGVKEKVKVYELISEKIDAIPNYQNYLQTIADDLEDDCIEEL